MKCQILIAAMISTLFCSCETAFESSLQGNRVVLLAPANNLITMDSVHTFYWNQVQGANRYQLQVVSPRFDSITRLGTDTIVTRNQFPLKLARGGYQWRVRAMNASTTSNYSDTFRLTIQ